MKSETEPTERFKYYKRNLPHYEDPGNYYFITFTAISRLEFTDIAKDAIWSSIKYHSDKKYTLFACVVMKTHVHLILLPLNNSNGELFSLSQIMHSIKSYSAKMVNKVMFRKGQVWLEERYDWIIRDDEDFNNKMNYIIYNPVKAGIVKEPISYKWLFYQGME